MNMFCDEEIEERLIAAIDPVIESCSSFELTFEDLGEEEGINAYWDSRESSWEGPQEIDPLSLLLIAERTERESTNRMDNQKVQTLAYTLDRSSNWVRSFQHGWYGRKNEGTSIMGYLLGRKLRLKYL